MNDREEWRERVRDIRATSATWWWWYICIYIYIYIYMHTRTYTHMRIYACKNNRICLYTRHTWTLDTSFDLIRLIIRVYSDLLHWRSNKRLQSRSSTTEPMIDMTQSFAKSTGHSRRATNLISCVLYSHLYLYRGHDHLHGHVFPNWRYTSLFAWSWPVLFHDFGIKLSVSIMDRIWDKYQSQNLTILDKTNTNQWLKLRKYIIISSCHQHGYPRPFLTTSPYRLSLPAGPQGNTLHPHRAAVSRLELVTLLLLCHVKGSAEYITYELVPTSPALCCMSGSFNLDSFRDGWLVAVQLVLGGV